MAQVIDFARHYDKRARHRLVSEPSTLDIANDADAQAQAAIAHISRAHFMALGTGNAELVQELVGAGNKVVDIRRRIHQGIDLLTESLEVDPYRLSGPTDAA